MGESESRGFGRERGVTPIVGVALLVVIVVMVAITVFVIGSGALSGVTAQADTEQAVAAMNSLSHDVQSRGYASAELPSGGDSDVDPDAGWMRIQVGNQTVLDRDDGQLGTLRYRSGDTIVAYQGGGVWRRNVGGNATVVRAPPFQYARGSKPTLSLPVISLRGANGTVADDSLSTVETRARFPGENVSNPITEDVTITVQSEFYHAWGEFFAQRFDGGVSYDHDDRRASVALEGGNLTQDRDYNRTVRDLGGLQGFLVNEGSELDVRNDMAVDGYDSSKGPYPGSRTTNGDIRSQGDLQISNDVTVHGDVAATGNARFSSQIEVEGNTVIGDGGTLTTVDTRGGGGAASHYRGVFSTKQDLQVTGGVQFGDDVVVGGDLTTLEGDVDGDLYVHGSMVDEGGNAFAGTVSGDVVVAGPVELGSSSLTVRGEVIRDPTDARMRAPLDPVIAAPDPDVDLATKRGAFDADNDNDETLDVQARELQHCADSGGIYDDGCTLESGRYYLDGISLYEDDSGGGFGGGGFGGGYDDTDPETLTLDATDGPVTVYVDGDVDVQGPAQIDVRYDPDDPHPVRFYVDGTWRVRQGGQVEVPGHRSPLLQLYVASDELWRVEGGSTFTGVVYGLSDGSQRTEISVTGTSGTEIYGGFYGDISEFDKVGSAHFDEALSEGVIGDPTETTTGDSELDARSADLVYLHVDQRTVEAG